MARKVKFALEMADGAKIRSNIEELREHFDMESIVSYYLSGKLLEWLEDRYYDDEAAKIEELDREAPNINAQLCAIIGVDASKFDAFDMEAVQRLNEKKDILRQKTSDESIIANATVTALNQEDLADLLDLESPVIYLCGEKFNVPIRVEHKKYVGILGTHKVEIRASSDEDLKAKDILFENVVLPWSKAKLDEFDEGNLAGSPVLDVAIKKEDVLLGFPVDELKELYKDAATERYDSYNYKDEDWEYVDEDGELSLKEINAAKKKMIIRMVCKNQYKENEVVHACINEDMSGGFVLTTSTICMYNKECFEMGEKDDSRPESLANVMTPGIISDTLQKAIIAAQKADHRTQPVVIFKYSDIEAVHTLGYALRIDLKMVRF